jgi:CheY-like chemotaxis protein
MVTILFIEDDKIRNEILVSYMMYQLKWKVIWAQSVAQAEEMYDHYRDSINIILLDIMMPIDASFNEFEITEAKNGMNSGQVLLKRINNKAPGINIPVIILSAKIDIEIPKEYSFVKEILRKPIGIESIINAIRKNLRD